MAGDDIHLPTPFETWWRETIAWFGPPRSYGLTRWLVFRLLGIVYVFAFLGIIYQGPALLGSHGLTPVGQLVDRAHALGMTFVDLPSVFMWNASDTALAAWAYIGLAIALAVALGYANMPMLLALWLIYGSYERVGQTWWGFGWEIQILETTLLAAFMAHPWDPRPLAAKPPPVTSIVLMRWLVFRIMLGAGLIKLRGDTCWLELTCLDAHFETQPIPNPASAWFHHLPHAVHATGVAFNHVVEIVAPWFIFGPRKLRLAAGVAMAAFQVVLIVSGNLAFLNWLTLVPILACFDDDFVLRCTPKRVRAWLQARLAPAVARDGEQLAIGLGVGLFVVLHWAATDWLTAEHQVWLGCALAGAVLGYVVARRRRFEAALGVPLDGHQLAVGVFAALVIVKSGAVVDNLASHKQAMNRNYDRLELVNTYGAFGSVGMERHELVIEGTLAEDPATAEWRAYELPCKPGALDRRPCILGPYHRRLDWLIWFSAMEDHVTDPWMLHLVWKLLDGDRTIRTLFAVDPFAGKAPRWIRIRRFVYHLAPLGADTWWTRDGEQMWLPPVSLDTQDLLDALQEYGWPSPSDAD
jgi:hypothetical protein